MSLGRVAGVTITTLTKVVRVIIKTPATKAVFARCCYMPRFKRRDIQQHPARLFFGYRLENAHPTFPWV